MPLPERPQLRPFLAAHALDKLGLHYLISDQMRLSGARLRVTALELEWLQLFDGTRSLPEVRAEVLRRLGGDPVPLETLSELVRRMEDAAFLDGPRFRELAGGPVRRAYCTGSYEADPVRLRRQLGRLFKGPDGPGVPGEPRPDDAFRGALIPHIDYARGGRSYAWAFKEVFERTPASLFVIVGTSHYSRHRFTLTRKHFETPLGVAPTDQEYIDRLVAHYGDGLFDDELTAHLPEHSIELEVVLLQYLYEGRPFRIVPLVVGPFFDCVNAQKLPAERADIRRMIRALRAVERETAEPICYIISGDLAHVGPKFGDARPLSKRFLEHSRRQDQALLRRAEAADAEGYFRVIAEEADGRRICGLPPTYTVLEAVRPGRGKLLHYDQYVDPTLYESVSFASVAFYR